MVILKRTDSENSEFKGLVFQLDQDLAERNGETNVFFAQFNTMTHIKNTVVAFDGDLAVGCGAMRAYDSSTMEIKRMFVSVEIRGRGVAAAILNELEKWAEELGYQTCVLETGYKMPEAIGLYKKSGYTVIPNYGPYKNVESSIVLVNACELVSDHYLFPIVVGNIHSFSIAHVVL